MASFAGPSIVTLNQGLILHLSAPDTKSYNYQENLFAYSQDFTQASAWGPQLVTLTATTATTAPDGSLTAIQYFISVPSGRGVVQGATLVTGQIYTFSVYVKAIVNTSVLLRVNTSLTTVDVTIPITTGQGWTRISNTFVKDANFLNMQFQDVSGNTGTMFYCWGAQLNAGPAPAVYVVTTSTNITPSTSWIDLSLNKNNATLTNIPRYSSSSTGYLAFSSATSTAATMPYNIAYEFAGLSPYTFELWTRPYEDPGISTYRRIIGHEYYGPRDGYTMYVNNSVAGSYSLYHERWTNNNYIVGVGFTVPSASIFGTWNHIVVTFDGSIYNMYRNNVLVSGPATISSTGTLTAYGIQLTLASYYSVGNYSGDISDFKVYNRALTIAEIDRNFQAHRDRYGL